MIKEAYVSYEIAQLLKKKGFNWECRTCYEHGELKTEVCRQYADWNSRHEVWELMSAPTHQMVMKWLREKHNKHCDIGYDIDLEWCFQIINLKETVEYDYSEPKYYHSENETNFKNYEEAVEAALKYVLENLL